MTPVRIALAILLAIQLIVFEFAVLSRARFTHAIGGVIVMVLLGLVGYGAPLAIAMGWWRPRVRWVLPLLILVAVGFTLRFYVPLEMARRHRGAVVAETSPALIALLRELSAAQEQFRLRSGSYSSSLKPLLAWATVPEGASVEIVAKGDSGWAAKARLDDRSCSVWVRDPTLKWYPEQPAGSPDCGASRHGVHQLVRTIIGDSAAERAFQPADIFGTWKQHRVDEFRSGVVDGHDSSSAAAKWTTRVGGELRASVAVAGNQVFVGAHGNGEFVALHLGTGEVGFRIRVPNWVHHEPAITNNTLLVTFGNSEAPKPGAVESGSPPSGIAAYDRLTGVERWRRYTTGAVMTSPVVVGNTVTVVTNYYEAISWSLADGKQLWKTRLPGASPMGNPVVRDSLMVVGLEPARVCVLNVANGAIVHCNPFARSGWGAGHASPTLDGDLVLQVYEGRGGLKTRSLVIGRRVLGLPDRLGDEVLVALSLRDGAERWRVRLGTNDRAAVGHIAGTPVVVDGVAYVPSPNNGSIFAIRTADGRVLWSTHTNTARGSVLVTQGVVLAASGDGTFHVLDAATGAIRCKQKLSGAIDRAGPTLVGETAILTLRNGLVMARPLSDWLSCRA